MLMLRSKLKKMLMICTGLLFLISLPIVFATDNGIYVLAMGANTNGLMQANNDAQRFATAVQRKFAINGSNIQVIQNVSVAQFEQAINRIASGSYREVYVYFSGHGIKIRDNQQGEESDCYDEALVFVDGIYRDDTFVNRLNSIRTQRLTTVLDTCFSGGMTKALCLGSTAKAAPHLSSCSAPTTAKRLNGLVLTASTEDQLAWEIQGRGGRFTHELVSYLNGSNRSFMSAYHAAKKKIVSETQGTACYQVPQLIP